MAVSNIGYIINESSAKEIEFQIKNDDGYRVIGEGIIQEAEQLNRNKRVYAHKDLYREIYVTPRTRELLETGNLKGEAGHPDAKDLARQAKIEPKLTQVQYIRLWMDGNKVKARFRGTNNQFGDEFDKDLRYGEKPSFSLRALGSIENRNGKAYVNNLRVITWDRVYYPSHPTAYMEKLVSESTELQEKPYKLKVNQDLIKEYGNIQGVEEGFQIIAPFSNKNIIDYIKQESTNIKTIIENFDCFYQSIALSENGKMVTLVDKNYDTIFVPLEKYVQNEIMNYCLK